MRKVQQKEQRIDNLIFEVKSCGEKGKKNYPLKYLKQQNNNINKKDNNNSNSKDMIIIIVFIIGD